MPYSYPEGHAHGRVRGRGCGTRDLLIGGGGLLLVVLLVVIVILR